LRDLGCKLEDIPVITDIVSKSSPGRVTLDPKTVEAIYRESF
jgi:hypothetical protein